MESLHTVSISKICLSSATQQGPPHSQRHTVECHNITSVTTECHNIDCLFHRLPQYSYVYIFTVCHHRVPQYTASDHREPQCVSHSQRCHYSGSHHKVSPHYGVPEYRVPLHKLSMECQHRGPHHIVSHTLWMPQYRFCHYGVQQLSQSLRGVSPYFSIHIHCPRHKMPLHSVRRHRLALSWVPPHYGPDTKECLHIASISA